ncbi:MAG: ferredoxin reductase, partial [Nocardioides sp.]
MSTVRTVAAESTSMTVVAQELETSVRVAAKQVRADGVVSVDLVDVEGRRLPPWSAGAHVDVLLPGLGARQYSLCGDPDDRTTYRLGVLRDEQGRGTSRYVHDELQVGDVIGVRGPRNNFPLRESPRYLFIAGGIGIT